MRALSRFFGLLVMLSLFTLPAFAADADQPVQQSGLGLAVLLAGLLAIVVVGAVMARRESQGGEEDLV